MSGYLCLAGCLGLRAFVRCRGVRGAMFGPTLLHLRILAADKPTL